MTDIRTDDRTVVERSSFNVANVIVAIALLLLVLGIRSLSSAYFDMALLIALFGFVSTVALAKFLLRGEVIEP